MTESAAEQNGKEQALRMSECNSEGERPGFFQLMAYFREANAEGMRIRDRLTQAVALAGSKQQDDAVREFVEVRRIIQKEVVAAGQREAQIKELSFTDPENYAWYARELTKVSNAWDDLAEQWVTPTDGIRSLADLTALANRSVQTIDAMVFTCACQTIPDELENYLKNYRIGTSLDFVATFKD